MKGWVIELPCKHGNGKGYFGLRIDGSIYTMSTSAYEIKLHNLTGEMDTPHNDVRMREYMKGLVNDV